MFEKLLNYMTMKRLIKQQQRYESELRMKTQLLEAELSIKEYKNDLANLDKELHMIRTARLKGLHETNVKREMNSLKEGEEQ